MTDGNVPFAYGMPMVDIPDFHADHRQQQTQQQQRLQPQHHQQDQHQQRESTTTSDAVCFNNTAKSSPGSRGKKHHAQHHHQHPPVVHHHHVHRHHDQGYYPPIPPDLHVHESTGAVSMTSSVSSANITLPTTPSTQDHYLQQDAKQQQHEHPQHHPNLLPFLMCEQTLRVLLDQGYSCGLASAMMQNKQAFPIRIWVVDNSGSMAHTDGHRLVPTKKKDDVKFVSCSRWSEMQQTVDYHAQMAALLSCPTVFRLINDPGRVVGPQQFGIADRGEAYVRADLATAQSIMQRTSPAGVTPLVPHLITIRENIAALAPALRRDGTKVVLVIATDGLPTDERGYTSDRVKEEFVEKLRSLEDLPVWMVVRLCTDEAAVVEFWNGLDSQLELSLEVLDDFVSEAKEVHAHNKWLNYALPLHRIREMGFHDRLLDVLDERKLSKDEVQGFCRILFGQDKMDEVPDPQVDWKGFVGALHQLLTKEKKQWNPVSKKMEPWIDLKQLKKAYGGTGFLSSVF